MRGVNYLVEGTFRGGFWRIREVIGGLEKALSTRKHRKHNIMENWCRQMFGVVEVVEKGTSADRHYKIPAFQKLFRLEPEFAADEQRSTYISQEAIEESQLHS
jgi:hypothetical protein